MTDLEKVKRCAELMGYTRISAARYGGVPLFTHETGVYNPLTNKAQAFELVERLKLALYYDADVEEWWCRHLGDVVSGKYFSLGNADLCRAIVECVSKIPGEGD